MATHDEWISSMPVGGRGKMSEVLRKRRTTKVGGGSWLPIVTHPQLPIMSEEEIFELSYYELLKKLLKIPRYDDMKRVRSFFAKNTDLYDVKKQSTMTKELSLSLTDEQIFILKNIRSCTDLSALLQENDKMLIVKNFLLNDVQKVKLLFTALGGALEWFRESPSSRYEKEGFVLVKMTIVEDCNFAFACLDGYLVGKKLLKMIKVKDILGSIKYEISEKKSIPLKEPTTNGTNKKNCGNITVKDKTLTLSNNMMEINNNDDDHMMEMIEKNIMGIITDSPEQKKQQITLEIENKIKELISIGVTNERGRDSNKRLSSCELTQVNYNHIQDFHHFQVVEENLKKLLKMNDVWSCKS